MHKSDTKTFGRSRDEKDVDPPPPSPKRTPLYEFDVWQKK